MKTKSLVKAIMRAGLEVELQGNFLVVKGKNFYGSFVNQDGTAVAVSTCPNGERSNSMRDYFVETYHRTVKSFIETITR